MSGPDGVKIPPTTQGTGLGGKTFGDLYESLNASIEGDNVKLSGSLKTVKGWQEFSGAEAEQTGHYAPILLPSSWVGKDVNCTGRRNGDRKVRIDSDRCLVTRLENLTGLTQTLTCGDESITIDYTALVPVGEKAYKAGKTDFGRFGKREELVDGFNVTWSGTKATVTGKLKKFSNEKLTPEGYWLPIGMSDWYGDGIPKKAGINNITEKTEQDIVFSVTNPVSKPVIFQYNGLTIMELDLSEMTFDEAE